MGVSLAVAKAAAQVANQPLFRYIGGVNANTLPVPMMNILNGGSHADNAIDFQEFMVMPVKANSFSEALRMGTEVFHHLKSVLSKKKLSTNVGDEGGFAPNLSSNVEAIEVVLQAIEKSRLQARKRYVLLQWMRPALNFMMPIRKYIHLPLPAINFLPRKWSAIGQTGFSKYPIISIEDGMEEDDWDGWKAMTESVGDKNSAGRG